MLLRADVLRLIARQYGISTITSLDCVFVSLAVVVGARAVDSDASLHAELADTPEF
jgi:hypothetical protein